MVKDLSHYGVPQWSNLGFSSWIYAGYFIWTKQWIYLEMSTKPFQETKLNCKFGHVWKVIPRCLISPQKHQQSLVSTQFLEFLVNNGCKYLNLSYSKLEGSLNILEESQLHYLDLTLCEANEDIFTNLLYPCQHLEKLSLAYLNIIPIMIQRR